MALTDSEREALTWAGLIAGTLDGLGGLVKDPLAAAGLRKAAALIKATPIEQIAMALASLRTDEAHIAEGTAELDSPDIPVSIG